MIHKKWDLQRWSTKKCFTINETHKNDPQKMFHQKWDSQKWDSKYYPQKSLTINETYKNEPQKWNS